MGKKKSITLFVLITLVLVALCLWCTLSFSAGIQNFNSVISAIEKDTTVGGSNTVTYYPDGVISKENYLANLSAYGEGAEVEKQKYEAEYFAYGTGAIYLERESALEGESEEVSETFKEAFANDVKALNERFSAYGLDGTRVEVANDYTIRVTLPNLGDPSSAFSMLANTGEFTLEYGEGNVIVEETDDVKITDYITGISSDTAQGTSYVIIEFTDAGRELIKEKSADAANTASTLIFKVGDTKVVNLTVNEQIDQEALYISGNYTDESAKVVAILLDSAIYGTQTSLELTAGEAQSLGSVNGENTMLFLYLALGAVLLAGVVYFFVRYRGLGLVNLYATLTIAGIFAICLKFIPFLHLGAGVLSALIMTFILSFVANAIAFESAKREYATGKTMTSSVKTGYKKCFWTLFDTHVVVAIFSLIAFAIAITQLQTFAFTLMIGCILSGVSALLVTRFFWAVTMSMGKRKADFCNFYREEVEDDE